MRVSDGTQYPDPLFAQYWPAARAAGVIRGVYQFFQSKDELYRRIAQEVRATIERLAAQRAS